MQLRRLQEKRFHLRDKQWCICRYSETLCLAVEGRFFQMPQFSAYAQIPVAIRYSNPCLKKNQTTSHFDFSGWILETSFV